MSNSLCILIVDDVTENVSALFHFLDAQNFELLVAQNGESALELVEYQTPDLILLDVMMPGIDGFETCRQMKANPKICEVPIIFMTALSDTTSKIRGFELGAVDYITKPFQQEEVLARVNLHLALRQLQKNLQAKNDELALKNQELNAFTKTVAYDLKTPVTNLISLSEMLLEEHCKDLQSIATQSLQLIRKSGENMLSLINALLLLTRVSTQAVTFSSLDMSYIIVQVKQRLTQMITWYQGEIIVPKTWPLAKGYGPWIEEVWVNYLSNGLKYGGKPPRLELGATLLESEVRFWCRDNGQGLSPDAQNHLFIPFSRLVPKHSSAEGHGLGLYVVRRIIQQMGGEVGVDSREGRGSVFYFTLPCSNGNPPV